MNKHHAWEPPSLLTSDIWDPHEHWEKCWWLKHLKTITLQDLEWFEVPIKKALAGRATSPTPSSSPSPTPRSSAALLRGLPGWDKLDTMHHELRAWGSATRFSAIVPLKCKVQIYSCDRQVKCWGGKPMKASLKADYADNTKAGDCLKTCWVFSYMVSQNFPFLYKILQTFLILSKPSFPECCNC